MKIQLILPLAALGIALSACDDSSSNNREAVSIQFDAKLAGQALTCNGLYPSSVGQPASDYKLVEYRWYASDFHMRDASDNQYALELDDRGDGLQYDSGEHNVALLGLVSGCDTGAETPPSNFTVDAQVAPGDYTQLCFTLGVPFALNHSDVTASDTPSPLNLPAMNWNWRGGRKFMRFDGFGDPNGVNQAFNLHLGSTGCDSASMTEAPSQACSAPNTPTYCLNLTPSNRYNPTVSVDPARLMSATDITSNTEGTAAGCMSFIDDPECAEIMPKLGLAYRLNGQTVPPQDGMLFQ